VGCIAAREPFTRKPRRFSAPAATALHGPESSSSPGASTVASQGTTGVSFRLESVCFDLPDGKRLLKDISLAISPGRCIAVMGPSGSGKSTLLAVLSGRASYGTVDGQLLVGGRKADDLRFLQHVTGFVPQDDVLHGELTAGENIRFQAALRLPSGTSKEEIRKCVDQVAADLKLCNVMKERVGTPERRGISGGQRKRVSIAMELVSRPLLLFADEPTSGLDSTTSHEVVFCLNTAARRLGTTVISVIHQPRYDTLCLFDDLTLLGVGGVLVYAGEAQKAREYFVTKLHVKFVDNCNPADVLLDAIQQPPRAAESQNGEVGESELTEWLNVCAEIWRNHGPPLPDIALEEAVPRAVFHRAPPPFFRAVLLYMDRSMLQTLRAYSTVLVNQGLCIVTIWILCNILRYERLDQFMMQSAFAELFLMLLQGVAAQRIFGADLLITWREAQVGMPMVAYFVAKDLTALFEVSLSSAVFAAIYGSVSGAQLLLTTLFAGSWAFVYCVFGLSYIFSITLSPGAAQMTAVVSSFISFCVSGVYQPQLPEIAAMAGERGWMVPAVSPVRWLYGYLLTAEAGLLKGVARNNAKDVLRSRGYDLHYLKGCTPLSCGTPDPSIRSLKEAWLANRGWVCSNAQLLLLGVLFRFLAGVCLVIYVNAQTSGWARFIGRSDAGAWRFAGHLLRLLLGAFMLLFLVGEVYLLGLLR